MKTLTINLPSNTDANQTAFLISQALGLAVWFNRDSIEMIADKSLPQTLQGIIEAQPLSEPDTRDPLDVAIGKLTQVDESVWKQNLSIQFARENLREVIRDQNTKYKSEKAA